MTDTITQFRDAIRKAGFEPPESIEPGRFHRFPGREKGPENRAGWCFLFLNCLGGCFGDWSAGVSLTWLANRDWPHSATASASLSRQISAARAQAAREQRERSEEAAERADRIWGRAPAASEHHPYLVEKGIGPHNARLHQGCLVLPIIGFAVELASLQFIAADGRKRLLKGGRKRGHFIPVSGDQDAARRVVICEGFATGCTLAEDDPEALVLAAIDAGNLEPVAVGARRRWPSAELVIAGDDDCRTPGNPGATKAHEAAVAADALLALPQWPDDAPEHLTDFNDLANWLIRHRP